MICRVFPLSVQHTEVACVIIPGSKSHTIRALFLSAFAQGETIIYNALLSGDTYSCINVIKNWGAQCRIVDTKTNKRIHVQGIGYTTPSSLTTEKDYINVGNSGTTLYFATALAALSERPLTFDGDESIRKRTAIPLLTALQTLGATIEICNSHNNEGCVPYTVQGPLHNGIVEIQCSTSQYASALLYVLSFVQGKSTICPSLVGEHSYVNMTLQWLNKYKAKVNNNNYTSIDIVRPFSLPLKNIDTIHIPGDYSSAAFFFVAAAITKKPLHVYGLVSKDSQADAKVLSILSAMGCEYTWETDEKGLESVYIIREKTLQGGNFNLSEIPDSLPILAVAAAFADSPTQLHSVAHARKKETDRVAVMVHNLTRLGVDVKEHEDGLSIFPAIGAVKMRGGIVDSYFDHRIAMTFSIAGLCAESPISIKNAEVVEITFPCFYSILKNTFNVNIKEKKI